MLLGNRPPEILFLTHVHFDHCGAAAFLKKNFPDLIVAASQKASDILSRPNALSLMALLNQSAAEVFRSWHPEITDTSTFEPFPLDRVLADGDRMEPGTGSTVEVIAAPGHTWDSLSYYLPERKILIASEAAGCMDNTGEVVTEFLADYQAYTDTIRRLSQLDVAMLCQGHRIIFTGEDVPRFFKMSLDSALAFREMVETLLAEEEGDIGKTVTRVKALGIRPQTPSQTARTGLPDQPGGPSAPPGRDGNRRARIPPHLTSSIFTAPVPPALSSHDIFPVSLSPWASRR